MTYYIAGLEYDPNYLEHHGIKGQKWGVRRFQNEDGSLTKAGEERYYGHGSAGRFKRDLNRSETDYAQAVGRFRKAEAEDNRLTSKANKYVNKQVNKNLKKGITDGEQAFTDKQKKKIEKMANSHKALEEAKKAAMKDMKDIEAHQWKLIGAAASQGYSVLGKPAMRDVRSTGKYYFDAFMLGPIGSTALAAYQYGGDNLVEGRTFKVKNEGKPRVRI